MIPELRENTNTVIFDIGNVLIYFAWKEYLESLGFSEETNKHVADAMFCNKDWDAGDSGLVTTEEWLELFIENDPAYEKEIRTTFAGFGASIVPFPFIEEWFAYFREKGMKLYYLSNYSDEMFRQSEEKLAFLKSFDGGVFSWQEKCMKPDPKIYQILLDRYNIDPKHTVFFDDRVANMEAAEKFGIQGILFHTDIPLQMMGK